MTFSGALASRIRGIFGGDSDVTEKKMFGGIAFFVRGHMCCGIVGDDLMLRIGNEAYDRALQRPHVRAMDFTGRPMRGMIYVGPSGIKTRKALEVWLDAAKSFVQTLPPKKAKKRAVPRLKKLVRHAAR